MCVYAGIKDGSGNTVNKKTWMEAKYEFSTNVYRNDWKYENVVSKL